MPSKTKRKNKPIRMTKAQQRVAIAKDVILQVRAEKYVARTGVYVRLIGVASWECQINQQTLRGRKAPQCTVCAKGGLALSAIRKFNKWDSTAEELDDNHMQVIERFFGRHQADLIEASFEEWNEMGGRAQFFRENNKVVADDSEAIIAIMKNIIKNRGTFKP